MNNSPPPPIIELATPGLVDSLLYRSRTIKTNKGFIKYQKKNSTFAVSLTHTITTPYMGIGHIIERYKYTSTKSLEFVVLKHIGWDILINKTFFSLHVHYLHVKNCVL